MISQSFFDKNVNFGFVRTKHHLPRKTYDVETDALAGDICTVFLGYIMMGY